jgi:hypothetical protein
MRASLSSALTSLVLATMLSGCDSSYKATGVFAVKKGMTKQQVQQVAGTPNRAAPNCWLYDASKNGTSIDSMRFCFTSGQVSLIQTGVHLDRHQALTRIDPEGVGTPLDHDGRRHGRDCHPSAERSGHGPRR